MKSPALLAALICTFGVPAPGLADPGEPGSFSALAARDIEVTGTMTLDWVGFSDEAETAAALTWGDASAENPFVGGIEMRCVQLGLKGKLSSSLAAKVEVDLKGGEPRPKDVYLEFLDLPYLDRLRIGHQHEPLNRLSGSNKWWPFLEKPLPNAFSAGRNTGIRTLTDFCRSRLTFSAGAFRNTDGRGDGEEHQGYHLAARLTAVPVLRRGGGQLAHLGLYYSRRNPERRAVRFRQRAETHLGPYLVDTDELAAAKVDVLGFEAAAVCSCASLQAEYIQAVVDLDAGGAPRFFGYTVTATWLLTGEHRAYSLKNGAFTKLSPRRPFDPARGAAGAWMLLLRHSFLDLDDGPIGGGSLRNLSCGLNWYLTSNVRMMWNYIVADARCPGRFQVAQWRIQVHR